MQIRQQPVGVGDRGRVKDEIARPDPRLDPHQQSEDQADDDHPAGRAEILP
jgi:hypothetical protein